MNNFDIFQIAFLGKLPRDVIIIIQNYYILHRYIIIFKGDSAIRNCFVYARDTRYAIRQFIIAMLDMGIADVTAAALSLFYESTNCNSEILKYITENEKNIDRVYLFEHVDELSECVHKYNDDKFFKVVLIE